MLGCRFDPQYSELRRHCCSWPGNSICLRAVKKRGGGNFKVKIMFLTIFFFILMQR